MKHHFRQKTAAMLVTVLLAGQCTPAMVSMAAPVSAKEAILLADGSSAAPIIVDGSSKEADGIVLNAEAFAGDISLLTGSEPQIYKASVSDAAVTGLPGDADTAVIVGTAEDPLIKKLVEEEILDIARISEITGGYEQYDIQVVDNPLDGVTRAVVITGSDKRGAVYGMYHISQDLAGVSPWYYWGDVPVVRRGSLSFGKEELETTSKEPSVRFRGIFLNDEAPSLTSWVKKFGGYNQDFYDHVYELILRLKGNYLWPAMWSNNFSDDGTELVDGVKDTLANARHADAWGVIMGTSHHEPMCRAGVEWGRSWQDYGDKKDWNFFTNGEAISEFWHEGAARNKDFENVITIGMRGEADSPLVHEDGTKFTLAEQIEVLKQAVEAQKRSLQELGLKDSPQMICLYKEVEEAWYGDEEVDGLNKWDVLQNDIVMLCEDNHGNLRTLPTEEDKAYHKGGWGMYYHFDYHGGPRSYEWINTVPLEKIWNNMTMAYDYGVKDMWIVNVGDLKPMELPTSYFLDMAYDFETWGTKSPNTQDAYIEQWVKQQFGGSGFSEEAKADIVRLLHDYPSMNTVRKPETVASDTFSAANYNELQRKLAEAIDLEARAEMHLDEIEGSPYEDAYYQLVYYPAAATANVYKMQLFAGLNDKYAKSGSVAANAYALLVAECVQKDKDLQDYYNNTMSGGKWKGMMSSPHVGYVAWNADGWSYPTGKYVTPADGAVMLVDVDGTEACLAEGGLSMPEFTSTGQECYALTISNGGNERAGYTVAADKEWINVAAGPGSVSAARTLPVTVAWDKLPQSDEGTITVTSDSGKSVAVKVKATRLDTEGLADKTYTASDGVIVINADNYVNNSGEWKILQGLGRTGSTMKVFPTTDFYEPGAGPELTYQVYVPEDGTYELTAYVGPSNNVYADIGVRYAVQVDDGPVMAADTLDEKYLTGESNGWSNSILMAGRTAVTAHEMTAGVHTISIYGVDAGLLLEKLVLSDAALKKSHMGPVETWYVGKESSQQPLVHYQIEESMTLPGTLYAADAVNAEEGEKEDGVLNAQPGKAYEYPVTVSSAGYYQFSVKGSSPTAAQVVFMYGEQELGTLALPEENMTVAVGDGTDLGLGTGTITLLVTGEARIETVLAEKIDMEPGLPVTVFASSAAEGSSAGNAYDKKKATVWEPSGADTEPYVGLDFGETVYTDWFKLNGLFDGVTSYEIQMRDGENGSWSAIYEAEEAPVSGVRVYVQGTKACSGSQWRAVFHGGDVSVAELELNTYVNWAVEDESTVVQPAKAADGFANYQETSLIDGDRIASAQTGAWIATNSAGADKNYVIMTFGRKHTISAVNILAMQDAVLGSRWTGNPGQVPDDKLTSTHVRDAYQVFWQDDDGAWQDAGTLNTKTDMKVLSTVEFEKPVSTKAIKVVTKTNYAIRLAEIEAVQARKYTLDGVEEGYKNWALPENGGQISVSSTYSQSSKFLNDGIRVCGNDNANRWRANQFPAWVEIRLPGTISIDAVNLFGQQNAEWATEPTRELNNAHKYTPLVIQYWKDGQWADGTRVAESRLVWNQWKPESAVSTDKIRLYFEKPVGDGFVRLCEVEVMGTPSEDDATDELVDFALKENGASVTQENGEGGEASRNAVIDGDLTYNNGKRWRSNNSSQSSSLTVKLDGKKEISKIDLITQQPDSAKTDGAYPVPGKDAVTNLGIKKFNVYYNAATSSDAEPDWELLGEADEDVTGAGTRVWNSLELETPVSSDAFRFEFPKGSGKDGWVRVIELMLWGQEPKDPDEGDDVKQYAITVDGGIIDTIDGKEIKAADGKAGRGERVVVTADEEDEKKTFEKWEVKLAPDGFSLASSSNATARFDMPEGDVTLRAVYDVKTASPSNATAVSKAVPEGWAYGNQDDLDALLDDPEIVTEQDQAVLDDGGDVEVTLELVRKGVSGGSAAAKNILKAWSDEDSWQIAFLGQNRLSKKVTHPSGSSGTVMLATASNAVRITALIPEEWKGMEEEEYLLLTYTEEDGNYEVETVLPDWLTAGQIQMELPVNSSYAMLVPVFYTVTFKDYDGTVLKTEKVKSGGDAVPPERIPEREGYLFTGWSKDYTGVTKNLTITAKYSLISNEEKLISRLEAMLEELYGLDEGPVENEQAVKRLIHQIRAINFAGYLENEEVIDLLMELEKEICDILGILPAEVVKESGKIGNARVGGAVFGLEGGEGYLKIKDTPVPSRRPSGMEPLKNAFALDIKLYSARGSVQQVKGLLRISFELPDTLLLDDSLAVIHYTGSSDRGEAVPYELNGNEMTLVTDRLSIFAIGNITEGDEDDDDEDDGGSTDHDNSGSGGSSGGSGSVWVLPGRWKQDAKGWWYEEADGSYPVQTWKAIRSNGEDVWYYFDEQGYMKTGWFTDTDGYVYYLDTAEGSTNGQMVTGWKLIDGRWYFFNTVSDGKKGAMFIGRRTPDGNLTGADGAWIREQER